MIINLFLPLRYLFAIACVLVAVDTSAQTMYRCGSSYQDKPCTGQAGVVIGSAKKADTNELNSAVRVDPACKRRSEEAKKIIWMRDAGAQQSDLLAKSSDVENRRMIADVYAVRGNINDIRASIEKNCMEEKDRNKQFALAEATEADMQALRQLQQKQAQRAAQTSQTNDKVVKEAKEVNSEQISPDATVMAAKKRLPCPNLKNQMEIIKANLRTGADAQTMQMLNQQKRELDKEIAATCAQ
jgi:hypothetical protein